MRATLPPERLDQYVTKNIQPKIGWHSKRYHPHCKSSAAPRSQLAKKVAGTEKCSKDRSMRYSKRCSKVITVATLPGYRLCSGPVMGSTQLGDTQHYFYS